MYDEIEKFREYNDPLFDYTYMNRKTILSTFNIHIKGPDANYPYTNVNVRLQLSQVCLEGSAMDDLLFF